MPYTNRHMQQQDIHIELRVARSNSLCRGVVNSHLVI
jgi:hypothetical protein